MLSQSNKNSDKLSPPWEGPYVVTEVLGLGTYKLKTIDGEAFVKPRTTNSYIAFTLNLCMYL